MNAPMTTQNVNAWVHLSKDWQIARLTDWAAMLEERLAQLDPLYISYAWGRTDAASSRNSQEEK